MIIAFLQAGASSLAFNANPISSFTPTSLYTTAGSKSGSKGTGEGWLSRPAAPVNSAESAKLTLQESLKGSTFLKRLSLLGSTGSIGTQTLQIVDACPENFVVDALSAGTNAKLMTLLGIFSVLSIDN